jgi:flagellin-like hook-associated protein FlgL
MTDFRQPDADWKNNGSECPAFGVFAVTSNAVVGGKNILQGSQPSTTFTRNYAVNDEFVISANGYGGAFTHGLVRVLYDTGTPAVGETYGAKNGQFTVSKGYPGFTILGIVDSTNRIALARQESIDHLIAKPGSTVTKGSSGSFTVWLKSSGSWAASSYSITAEALGAECTSGKYAKLEFIAGYWIAGPLECP